MKELFRISVLIAVMLTASITMADHAWLPGSGPFLVSPNALVVADDGAIYLGTDNGVYKSADKGGMWVKASQGLNKITRNLVITRDGVLFAGTFDGVFKSADKGASWITSGTGLTGKGIASLAAAADGTLYAGASGEIFRSADGGTTWVGTSKGLPAGDIHAVVTTKGGAIFVATDSGIFRSFNKGATWSTANNGLATLYVSALTATADGTLYAGAIGGFVFKSEDNGDNWTDASRGLPNSTIELLMATTDGTLYAGTGENGLFKSVDKGGSWMAAHRGLGYPAVWCMAETADGTLFAGALYIGSHVGAIFKSTDKGANWTAASRGMTDITIAALAIDADGVLYAGGDGGLYTSVNSGASWISSSKGLGETTFSSGIMSVESLAITDDGAVYAGMSDRIYKSRDKGRTWLPISRWPTVEAFWHLTAADDTLYAIPYSPGCAASNTCIYKSTDKGANWVAAGKGITSVFVSSIEEASDGVLYAVGVGGAFKSDDRAATWKPISQGLPSKENIVSIAVTPDGVLVAGTTGQGIYKSTDKGASWKASNQGLINLVVSKIVAASNGTLYAGTSGGIFKSQDKGESWHLASQGLESLGIQTLLATSDGTLYASIKKRGVFKLPAVNGVLKALEIISPATIVELGRTQLVAQATYDSGVIEYIRPVWSVDNSTIAEIDSQGVLATKSVDRDTRLTITASYTESGITKTISRSLIIQNLPPSLTGFTISGPAFVPNGGAVALAAIARFQDGTSTQVNPIWQVSGPATIDANGIVSAQRSSGDAQLKVGATYGAGTAIQNAGASLAVKDVAKAAKELRITGPTEIKGGQIARYKAALIYEDNSEVLVVPVWASQDAESPISSIGELRAADVDRNFNLVANYSDAKSSLVASMPIQVKRSTAKANTLQVVVAQSGSIRPGDSLRVGLSLENFDPLVRQDIYAAIATPTNDLIFIGGSDFSNSRRYFKKLESIGQRHLPLLDISLPFGLPGGTYTFYAVTTKAGANVEDQSNWTSVPSPFATSPGISSATISVHR